MKAIRRAACAVLAAMTLAGCAGNSRTGGEYLAVTVENDGTIPTHIRVYLVPGSGQETLVGTMTTFGKETLTTRLSNFSGSYQLRAEGGTGYVLMSPRVQLRGNEGITWDMRRNIIHLGTR